MYVIPFSKYKYNMLNLDKQIEGLQTKIQEQEGTFTKLKNEEQKLANYIKQFKQAIKRKTAASNQSAARSTTIDTEKQTQQLEKEIQSANLMLKNYQNQFKNVQKKATKMKADDLSVLEQTFKDREFQLRKIKQEIKDMQATKRRQQKMIQKKAKIEDGGKLSRIVEQVRKNLQLLQTLKIKRKSKIKQIDKKKEALREMEQKYIQKCQQIGEKPVSYQDFKQKRRDKKRDEQQSSKPKMKKVQATVRDIINSQMTVQNYDFSQKGIKDLQGKKEVAQNSLKNAHKRYEKQMDQLMKKFQELKKQNETLTTRLLQKIKQKQITQLNMNMNQADTGKNYSITRTVRKLSPIKS